MPPSKHSSVGASGMYRWGTCPGSVRLCATVPKKPASKFAAEGSAAHELGEMCLIEKKQANEYLGLEIEEEGQTFVVDEEMAEHVQLYVDTIVNESSEEMVLLIERPFNLDWLYPGMYGTNDAASIEPFGLLRVYDLKYGAGVTIEVTNEHGEPNPQLMYYALGVLGKDNPFECDEVEIVIIQPRADHPDGPVRRLRIPVDGIYLWANEVLLPAVKATEKPDAPLVPGKHCQFCNALGVCSAVAEKNLALAQQEFAPIEEKKLPNPEALSNEQLSHIMKGADLLSSWMGQIQAAAQNRLENGAMIPGFKLVKKRANRKWIDEATIIQDLYEKIGPAVYNQKIKSPAQMEKVYDKEELKKYWTKDDTGVTVAPESDRRKAIIVSNQAELDFQPIH